MKPDTQLPSEDPHHSDPRHWLSALADGEGPAADPACQLWRDDEAARQTWHAYHLIGDVMRSDELATSPERDRAFMAALRVRLADEPVVLAPSEPPAPADRVAAARRQPWLVPAAMAAGFVLVAGVLVVTRSSLPGAPQAAAGFAAASSPQAAGGALGQAPNRQLVSAEAFGSAPLITDPRLDEFLRAHQAASGGVAVAAPGGTLRRVEVVVPAGPAR